MFLLQGTKSKHDILWQLAFYGNNNAYLSLQLKDAPQEFYRSGLQYLAFTSIATIPQEERVSLAFDMSIAALIGEDIYNFGELVRTILIRNWGLLHFSNVNFDLQMGHEIMSALQGTGLSWVRDIISAFSNGNLAGWKQLQVQHASHLNQQVRSHK